MSYLHCTALCTCKLHVPEAKNRYSIFIHIPCTYIAHTYTLNTHIYDVCTLYMYTLIEEEEEEERGSSSLITEVLGAICKNTLMCIQYSTLYMYKYTHVHVHVAGKFIHVKYMDIYIVHIYSSYSINRK